MDTNILKVYHDAVSESLTEREFVRCLILLLSFPSLFVNKILFRARYYHEIDAFLCLFAIGAAYNLASGEYLKSVIATLVFAFPAIYYHISRRLLGDRH